jgi:phosphoadenosine phosphosulfate reductase
MDKDTREKYLLIAKMNSYKRKLLEANRAIETAIKTCKNPAVYWSYGKDSTVVVHMASRIKPDILVINIDRGKGGDLQEAVQYGEEFAQKYNLNYHRVKTPKEIFEIYKEAGSIYNLEIKTITNNLLKGIKTAREQFDINCEINGLRAQESYGRSFLRKYGTFHYSENEKIYKCKPVLYWAHGYIWAYIVSNDLPYMRWYDLESQFTGYEFARYSNWAGIACNERGRFLRLKVNYPDEFQLLAEVLPEIRHFV